MSQLGERFPGLARTLPRRPLARLPSALEPAPGLAAALGLPGLFRKRDDACSDRYGGNKVRKLEFLLGEALARGCDGVITFGAVGSNHVLATALHAASVGLACHGVVVDQPPTPAVARTLRWHGLAGTRLHPARGFAGAAAVAAALRAGHPGGPDRLYEIPWGGSSWLGTVGFVVAGLELAAQLHGAGLPTPGRIYLPLGTMGTVAGLLLGLRLAGLDSTVVAVKVVPQPGVDAAAVATLCETTTTALRALDATFPAIDDPAAALELRPEFLGAGYADITQAADQALALAADHGCSLDTTYSAKAFACLIADAAGRPGMGPALFWQTYNSVQPPAAVADVTPDQVPGPFRHYLTGPTVS